MPKISAASLDEHRAQTLDRIFDAVARLAREKGIDMISLTDVASAAGITRTALYNYFPDKAALLVGFTERVTAYFIESFEHGLPRDADAVTRLRAFIRLQLDGLMAHPHPGAAEITAALGPEAYASLAGHVAPMQKILVDILRSGVDNGEFREVDPELAARSVLAVVGAERVPLISGQVSRERAEKAVTDFAVRALLA